MESRIMDRVGRRGRGLRAGTVDLRELALLSALAVAMAMAAFGSVGTSMLARWASLGPFVQW
jgi:hypothetical protein